MAAIKYQCFQCKDQRTFNADIVGNHLTTCGNCGWLTHVTVNTLPECDGGTASSEDVGTGSIPVGSNLTQDDKDFLEELKKM